MVTTYSIHIFTWSIGSWHLLDLWRIFWLKNLISKHFIFTRCALNSVNAIVAVTMVECDINLHYLKWWFGPILNSKRAPSTPQTARRSFFRPVKIFGHMVLKSSLLCSIGCCWQTPVCVRVCCLISKSCRRRRWKAILIERRRPTEQSLTNYQQLHRYLSGVLIVYIGNRVSNVVVHHQPCCGIEHNFSTWFWIGSSPT